MLKKRKDDPEQANKVWSLQDANAMLTGTFYQEEAEPGDEVAFAFLNRENIKEDFNLKDFETVVAQILEQEKIEREEQTDKNFEEINKKDEVSQEIRTEFDLPDNITGSKINFNEIRRSDAARKRKTPIWSGQDVMCVSYNFEHAE